MDFEWDRAKAIRNLNKHGVAFQEAARVFSDPLALTFNDPDHSSGGHGLLTFGMTQTGTGEVVSHSELDASMRIISARLMTRQERKIYGEG